jgi:dihydroxy-acid dehydratase
MYHVEDVHRSGGIHTILGEVARGCPDLLNLQCHTVTGKTLGENIAAHDIRAATVEEEALELAAVGAGGRRTSKAWTVEKQAKNIRELDVVSLGFNPYDCIRTVASAYSKEGGLAILYGNLAPEGSVVKTAGVDDVELSDAELAERRRAWKAPAPRFTRGWLARYSRLVTSAHTGAVLQ